ncbi:MAG: LptF/LptG family permease, partial [Kangiellaceae bacterium]|nr:LptF/LptG family permease [Kangiellaceae bacterium]
VFVESRNSEGEIERLFSVSGLSKEAENIEIQLAEKGKIQQIEDAESGSQLSDGDFLVLQNGVNYQFSKQSGKWNKTEYESYFMRLEDDRETEFSVRTKGIGSFELLRIGDLKSWAELHWRLSAPISILILCFLAVPLAKTQPRKGKFSRLFPAIMIYMVYALLLMNGKQLLESGRIPQPLGFWWIHLIAMTFCLWTYRSNNNRNKNRRRASIAAKKGTVDV